MPFFSELLDTGRVTRHERAAAQAIQQLRALADQPCQLATRQAGNSTVLLDDCNDSAFYSLVADGRIRFRRLPDGTGPRQELARRLGVERYLDTWPETQAEPSLCEAAKAVVLNKAKATGCSTLDQRLDNADRLFSAIEQFDYRILEKPRRTVFERLIRNIHADIPDDEENYAVRALMTKLGARPDAGSRSALYAAIQNDHTVTVELEKQATDVIDAVLNKSMAFSLDQKLLSARRIVPLGPRFHEAAVNKVTIETADIAATLSPAEERDLLSMTITWEDINVALGGRTRPNVETMRLARQNIARIVASKSIALPAIAKGGIYIAGGVLVHFAGPLHGWFSDVLSVAGFALGLDKTKATYNAWKTTQVAKKLDGWLDRLS